MEGDDRAVTGVFLHVVHHLFGRQPLGIVAGDDIPHHHLELPAEPGILAQAHPTMGRTHQSTVDIGVGLLHIITVFLDGMSQAADVVMGVVAHTMSFVQYLLEQLGILPDIVAYTEEGGLNKIYNVAKAFALS